MSDGVVAPLGPSTAAPAATAGAGDIALASLLAGAGLVHVAMAPAHLGSSTSDGAGFLAAGVVQLGVAALLVIRPRRWVRASAGVVSAVAIAAWVVSRTAGLPYGEHQGTAESIAFVDGATATLEASAVVGAARWFLRASDRPASDAPVPTSPRNGILLKAFSVGALALALAAIASPSARNHGHSEAAADGHHAATGHDHTGTADTATTDTAATDGHRHGSTAVDDLGYSELVNGQMGSHAHPGAAADAAASLTPAETGLLAQQLAATAALVEKYPTVADAKAAGYRQQGPFSPGLGVHFSGPMGYNADGDMDPEDLASGMLIYDGLEDDSRLAGFMYMAYQKDPPEGFAGDLDIWHFHTATCIVMTPDGIDTPFGADLSGITEEMCAAEGGTLIQFTGYMVHVWTVPGYESPEGVFSDLNPKITCPDGTYHRIDTRKIGHADTTCLSP
jgi:hypothetical protein